MRGFAAIFRGIRFVYFDHPGLIRFWLVPVLVTACLIAGVAWGAWEVRDDLLNAWWTVPQGEDLSTSVMQWLHSATQFLAFALMFGIGLAVAMIMGNVVAAPFNDLLSEEVERIVAGHEAPKFSLRTLLREARRAFALAALRFCIYLLVMLPLLVMSFFLPGVGQAIYAGFAFAFTAAYLAMDYLDWPIARRGLSVSYRFRLLSRHPIDSAFFGSMTWALLWVPGLHLLAMPAAVAGGTLMFLDWERKGTLPRGGASVRGATLPRGSALPHGNTLPQESTGPHGHT